MATTGETKWSALVSRHYEIASISRQGDYAHIDFELSRWFVKSTAEVLLQDFSLPSYIEFPIPQNFKLRVTLVFRRYNLGSRKWGEVRINVKWPYTTETRKGIRYVMFRYNAETILYKTPYRAQMAPKVWAPVVNLSSGKKNPKKLTLLAKTPKWLPLRGIGPLRRVARQSLSLAYSTSLRFQQRRARKGYGQFSKSTHKRPNPEVRYSQVTNATEGVGQPYAGSVVNVEAFYRTYSSVSTPGFRSLRKEQLPVNPFSCTIRKTDNAQAYDYRHSYANPNGTYSNAWGSTSAFFSPEPSPPVHNAQAYDKALARLLDKAQLGIDANIAQDLIEFHQTNNMIRDVAYKITKSVTMLRKGNVAGAASVLLHGKPRNIRAAKRLPSAKESIANQWLALQYGWKPLLQDIEGSMVQLARYAAANRSTLTVRATAKVVTTEKSDVTFDTGTYAMKTGNREIVTSSTCRLGVRYTVPNPLKSFAAQLGFTAPINLAWEVLPYSFVVDWFLPIGPYLQSFSAWDGVAFVDGYQTNFTRQNTSVVIFYDGVYKRYPANNLRQGGGYQREYVICNRVKLTTFPYGRVPQLKNPMSVVHTLNALALMVSALQGR